MLRMIACPRCGSEVPEGFRFCGRCGESLAGGAAGGPPRVSRSVLIMSLVFVVALAVISVGMFEWITIATTVPPVPKPTVALGSAVTMSVGYQWLLRVTVASSAAPPSSFRLSLSVGGYSGPSAAMPPYSGQSVSVYIPYYSYPFYISWSDNDNGGTLTVGDTFVITYGGYASVGNGTAFTFSLLWSDGTGLASQTWYA